MVVRVTKKSIVSIKTQGIPLLKIIKERKPHCCYRRCSCRWRRRCCCFKPKFFFSFKILGL